MLHTKLGSLTLKIEVRMVYSTIGPVEILQQYFAGDLPAQFCWSSLEISCENYMELTKMKNLSFFFFSVG